MARTGRRVDVCGRLLRRARPLVGRVLHRAEGRGDLVKRALVAFSTFALLVPANAFARGVFDPTKEFEQHEWVPIHLGALNLSITKAVAYLMLGSVMTIALGIVFMRVRLGVRPGVRQTIGEQIYEVAETQIAEQGLPSKAIGRWFPYVPSL